jgi:hypothetical protein
MTQRSSNTKQGKPFLRLVDAKADTVYCSGDTPNTILKPGVTGQQEWMNRSILPTGSGDRKKKNEKILQTARIELLGAVQSDLIFQHVALPVGWKKMAHGHRKYSCIIDEKSRKRVEIIYTDTERGQKVHVSLCRRFRRSFDYNRFCETGVGVTKVTDSGTVIYTTKPIIHANESVVERANAVATAWLNIHYPQWRDASAYWD